MEPSPSEPTTESLLSGLAVTYNTNQHWSSLIEACKMYDVYSIRTHALSHWYIITDMGFS